MPGTNTYKDTETADYLDAIRKHQAENRSANSSARNFTPTHVLQRLNTVNISNSVTRTTKTLGDYDVVDNTSKLVAYLPFDLDSLDHSNSNNGTWSGTETYVDSVEMGDHGQRRAADFDGSSYITIPHTASLSFNNNNTFSIFCRFKIDTIGVSMVLVAKDDVVSEPSTKGYALWVFSIDKKIKFNLTDGTTNWEISTTSTVDDNHWHTVIGTYAGTSNRSGMKLYLDGILEATGTAGVIGTITNTEAVSIGAESDGGLKITGQIDDVQIWNVELDSTDVTDLYHGKQINKDTAATNPAFIGLTDIA